MTKIIGYNVKLRKKEEIHDPKIKVMKGKGGSTRHAVHGVGSDGTKMYKFISASDYTKLKSEGVKGGAATGGRSRSRSRSKSRGSKGKRGGSRC